MLVYAIRHAESEANTGATSRLNSELTELGRRQAERLAARFAGLEIKAIYCSPFTRCLQTALPLATELGLPIRVRPDLCEHHHIKPGTIDADHELKALDDIREVFTAAGPCDDWAAPYEWVPVDEERAALVARMRGFASYLKERWDDGDAVIAISHGSPVARLIDGWLTDTASPSFRFIIDNAAVSALRHYREVSSLICLNEGRHLHELDAPAAANYEAGGAIKPIPPSGYW